MTILTKREVWRRPRALPSGRTPDLTPEEAEAAKRAIRFLRTRLGGAGNLAAAMGVERDTLGTICARRGKPSVAMALRAARVAGVAIEAILAGAWPGEGACPHCGRG